MNLTQHFLTKNECYTAGKKITVKGLMIHSTGANNPKLSRYIDDPSLAPVSSNHWNVPRPGGRQVCVHGFIGLDKEGDVRTIQTLPWNHRGWGGGGSSNDTHIHVEICEGDLNDAAYFAKVYKEAVELFVHLCKLHGLTEKNVITHCEGFKQGVASNHADVMHWFPKHGKSMDTFRADIKAGLAVKPAPAPTGDKHTVVAGETLYGIATKHGMKVEELKALNGLTTNVIKPGDVLVVKKGVVAPKPAPAPAPKPVAKTIDQLAHEVIDGKLGSGEFRRQALGAQYDAVQKRVNEILNPPKPAKSIAQLVDEVIKGLHGSGEARKKSLGANYAAVQAELNRRF